MLGGLAAFLLFFLVASVSPGGLGSGDIKLAAFLGFVFGFPYVFWALVAGALGGGITAIFLLCSKKGGLQSRFPYAPFLCFGAIVALLYDPTPWLFAL
jgi:prepilin signal peptidase PulO-like enzyme (type II secretory pathway)